MSRVTCKHKMNGLVEMGLTCERYSHVLSSLFKQCSGNSSQKRWSRETERSTVSPVPAQDKPIGNKAAVSVEEFSKKVDSIPCMLFTAAWSPVKLRKSVQLNVQVE